MFIPSLVSLIFSIFLLYTKNPNINYFIIPLSILVFFLSFFGTAIFLYSTIFETKDYSSAVSGGKKFFWRYLLLMITQAVFLILLFFALVVPAIIFIVYWALAEYVLFKENKGVMDSLRGIFRLIKNNWWRVVGYNLLLSLIFAGIYILFSIPSWPTNIMVFIDAIKNPSLYVEGAAPTNLGILNTAISGFFGLFSKFITFPLIFIFSKYLYLALKKD